MPRQASPAVAAKSSHAYSALSICSSQGFEHKGGLGYLHAKAGRQLRKWEKITVRGTVCARTPLCILCPLRASKLFRYTAHCGISRALYVPGLTPSCQCNVPFPPDPPNDPLMQSQNDHIAKLRAAERKTLYHYGTLLQRSTGQIVLAGLCKHEVMGTFFASVCVGLPRWQLCFLILTAIFSILVVGEAPSGTHTTRSSDCLLL